MNIRLEPFKDSDIPLFTEWIAKERIKEYYTPNEDWIEEVSKRENEYSWINHYIIYSEDTPIGFCQYYPYWMSGEDWNGNIPVQNTYSIDYLIGNDNYLRKGCASKALKLLNSIIFTISDARRIIVQPDEANNASRNTLFSVGYSYDEENKVFILENLI